MMVLAVDLGIGVCGYVICNIKNLDVGLIKEGQIRPSPKGSLPKKLDYIFEGLNREIKKYNIETIIVEKLYSHHRHPTTLGVLAQVKGVVALLSQKSDLKFFEYSSTRARKSLIGRGNVDSMRVKKMAEELTGRVFKSTHTADAFSLAVAFSHAQKLKKVLKDSF